MANSGRTNQPGGYGSGRNHAVNEVKDTAAAWRGDRLRTPVSFDGLPSGTSVTIGDRTMVFRGWTLNFFLRPGIHEAALDDEGVEVTEVNGEPGTEIAAGAPASLTVAEVTEPE